MNDKERIAADIAASKAANAKMKAELAAGAYDDRPSYADYKAGIAAKIAATSAELRDAPAPVAPEMVKCSCGHTVSRSQVMNASMGTSCPDCYDCLS